MKKLETLTPNEIAKILRIHPFTVTRLAREGHIDTLVITVDKAMFLARKTLTCS